MEVPGKALGGELCLAGLTGGVAAAYDCLTIVKEY